MCSESLPKEFEKTTEVLPLTNYGLSSMQDFQEAENKIHQLEWLKRAGLDPQEIKLYQENEGGLLKQQKTVEATAMKAKLDVLYSKIKLAKNKSYSTEVEAEKVEVVETIKFPSESSSSTVKYPEGHPMNHIKEIEVDLFGHLHEGEIPPLSKRMKMLRRFERKKAHSKQVNIATCGLSLPSSKNRSKEENKKFTWSKTDNDGPSKEWPDRPAHILNTDLPERTWGENSPTPRNRNDHQPGEKYFNEQPEAKYHKYLLSPRANKEQIGPSCRQLYTIKGGNIVRLQRNCDGEDEYEAEDIVVPENQAEEQLLEGTKMTIDNIRKIERFREYEPGVPSKSLYLKNVAPAVTEEQLSVIFNQFVQANGGPVSVRLMKAGRMRGQAFVDFQDEEVAVQALTDVNGTIMSGRPIIAHFARNVQCGPPG